jgi:DNA-binding transcriptional MerR regulator
MTIGEFSAETRLSRRALRIYDSMELLCPVAVDPYNRYRRYSADQVAVARRIQLLRAIGMPLGEIQALPRDEIEAAEAIRQFWERSETTHTAQRELFRHLSAILRGEPLTMYDISTREVNESKVVSMTRRITVRDLSPFIGEAMNALLAHAKESAATGDEPFFVVFHGHVDEESDGPVEVCVPVDGQVEPVGEIGVRIEPAHEAAYTRLTKGQLQFPSVLSAYDAVHDWIAGQTGLQTCAPPREVYFADWPTAREGDEVCDIAWPFRRTD